MYKKINKIHLIGIGGIGMSGIAELLLRNGYAVSGSDLSRPDGLKHLTGRGISLFTGHSPHHVAGAELVVYSSAIDVDNVELVAAREGQIPVITRAEMLAELMRLKYGIAIAGAHGKTTTTSMIGTLMVHAGLDPTVVVGGRVDNFGGTNARLGSGEFMVVEADESDGSFNKLSPSISVVTNLDREHMDHYRTMRNLKAAFVSFMNKVPFYGLCIWCGDDPNLRLLSHRISRRKKTYGFKGGNTYQIVNFEPVGVGSLTQIKTEQGIAELRLNVPGKHNALNAVAALMVADELSVPRSLALAGLASFQGVQRRFQKRGQLNGVTFFDDYAHHPSEISATLSAARDSFPNSKIRVVFQPHRYSRVEDLFDEFSKCFKNCDSVTVTDIYAAGEPPIPGIDSSILAENISRFGSTDVDYVGKSLDGIQKALSRSGEGDIILTLGAGDLPNVYKQIFSKIDGTI
jgi:UDP-N-acetylmuramate--alanine ligase